MAVSDSAAITAINDAIGSLSSAQLGNAVAGEAAATIATANVMMASSRAFASDAATSSSSPPPNAGGAAPAVSLGASVAVAYEDGTEVASDTPVDTQVQQWGYNIYADSAGTSTTSSLVSLSVSTNEGGRRRRLKLMERRRLDRRWRSDGAEPLVIVLAERQAG